MALKLTSTKKVWSHPKPEHLQINSTLDMFCPLKLCTKSEEEISVFLSFVTIFTVSLVEICTLLSALLWFFCFIHFLMSLFCCLPLSFLYFSPSPSLSIYVSLVVCTSSTTALLPFYYLTATCYLTFNGARCLIIRVTFVQSCGAIWMRPTHMWEKPAWVWIWLTSNSLSAHTHTNTHSNTQKPNTDGTNRAVSKSRYLTFNE